MKRKDVWIAFGIIAAALLLFYFYTRGQGSISIHTPGVKMELRSGFAGRKTITSESGPVKLSARAYRPYRITIRGEEGKDRWRIRSMGHRWGKLARIKVRDGQTTALKLGPPFKVRPKVSRYRSGVSVGLSVVGQAGEHYNPRVSKNGRTLMAPRLKIIDEQGKVLAAGKFAYG